MTLFTTGLISALLFFPMVSFSNTFCFTGIYSIAYEENIEFLQNSISTTSVICNKTGKFAMDSIDYTERTCIVVVDIEGNAGTIHIGIVEYQRIRYRGSPPSAQN